MDSGGWRVQAPTPARASDALISFRNWRRPFGSFHSEACSGNSRCRYSRNWSVSASSPRLRQYMRPSEAASRDRIGEESMCESASSFRLPASGLQLLVFSDRREHRSGWSLPVARRAARQLFNAANLVLLHQARTEAWVVGGSFPRHVVDLVPRPDVLGRIAVAVQAPGHLEGRC